MDSPAPYETVSQDSVRLPEPVFQGAGGNRTLGGNREGTPVYRALQGILDRHAAGQPVNEAAGEGIPRPSGIDNRNRPRRHPDLLLAVNGHGSRLAFGQHQPLQLLTRQLAGRLREVSAQGTADEVI